MISVTVCACALYVMEFPNMVTRKTFRGLVLLILVSWVWDFLYLFFLRASSSDEDEEDGGMEYTVRRFSMLFTWISFFWRVIVILIFWKVSLEFTKLIRQRGAPLGESDSQRLDDDFENILEEFGA